MSENNEPITPEQACQLVIATIEARHKHRGWTTGKRKWELTLVNQCKKALGLPFKKEVKREW